jgi:alpha-1,3-rhamnosyl/mannosyltransferase
MLRALAHDRPDDLEHVLFALAPFVDAHPDLADAFETVVLPQSGRVKGLRVAAEQSWLPAQLRRRAVAVAHHAGGTVPLAVTRRPERHRPTVLTLHDLQPLDHPEHFGAVKRRWLAGVVPASLRAADVVVAPSRWVADSAVERVGLDPRRVRVVPHGLPPVARPTPEPELRRRYELPGRVVLYPAITYPHKDHVTVVRAFGSLAAERPDLTLVLTGRSGRAEPDLRAEIARLGIGHRVRRTGAVPFADVAGLTDLADAVAFPSRYEGFGLPVLEAMGRGTPVVAADATALPELVGDGGRLVAPGAVDEWAGVLAAVLDDPAEAGRLVAAGRRRAAGFSPAACAAGTVAAHRVARDRTAGTTGSGRE